MTATWLEHMEHTQEHMQERLEPLILLAGTHGTHEKPPVYRRVKTNSQGASTRKNKSHMRAMCSMCSMCSFPMKLMNFKCSFECSTQNSSVPAGGVAP